MLHRGYISRQAFHVKSKKSEHRKKDIKKHELRQSCNYQYHHKVFNSR